MILYATGDLLNSRADALVNTVNCEGYMGKGLAYQFKKKFPKANDSYVEACKCGRLKPGKLHYFLENGKIVINFPTKNKWREKSRIEYISHGMDELVVLIKSLGIKSIAIPPLGSGNGGLVWSSVKEIVLDKLKDISSDVNIFIYDPSLRSSHTPMKEPVLGASAIILMEIKLHLSKFSMLRLQKAAYFMDYYSYRSHFDFCLYEWGLHDYQIDSICYRIRAFQKYHGNCTTDDAKTILYRKIASKSLDSTIKYLSDPIRRACELVNSIDDDQELEWLADLCFLDKIKENPFMLEHWMKKEAPLAFESLTTEIHNRFSRKEILDLIHRVHAT